MPPVCIVGMHRSGTSMVAQALHEVGLFFGPPADLMPAGADNPEGFWEHLDAVNLNDELLNEAGGGWDCPPPADVDWADDRFAPYRERAAAFGQRFAGREPWGWKDPRSSLTLPVWQAAIDPLSVLLVVRNPLEVALSLRRRNGFSLALGLTLWRIYADRVLAATRPETRVVTHYDAWFGGAEREVRRVLAALGLPAPATVGEVAEAVAGDLKHHRLTGDDLEAAGVDTGIRDTYRALCAEAGWDDPTLGGPAATVGERRAIVEQVAAVGRRRAQLPRPSPLEAGIGRSDHLALELQLVHHEAAQREARIVELEAMLKIHETARTELEGKVVERDGRLAERDRRLVEQDAALQRLQREVKQAERAANEQREENVVLARRLAVGEDAERTLRDELVSAHDQLLARDAEVLATFGAALAAHAPNAPVAVYHRQLLGRLRETVAAQVPADAPLLVATFGDDSLLDALREPDGRRAFPYPAGTGNTAADYTTGNGTAAIEELERHRAEGIRHLVLPAPAQAWFARYPELRRHVQRHYRSLVEAPGTCTIYDLGLAPTAVGAEVKTNTKA